MMDYRSTQMPAPPWSRCSIRTICAIFLPAFALFCIGAMTDIRLPGIYMDAVNPDYLVVRLLNPAAIHMPAWFLPGAILFHRFPIIGQIYHGALPFYIGLPFYALFGTGVVGVRLTNMVFGLLVLSGAGAFMWAAGARVLICSLSLALLALDPGFLFSFRTQFYITLMPVAAILASAAMVMGSKPEPTRWFVMVAGLLAGVSCYGYFIFVFLVPALVLVSIYRWHRLPIAVLLCWLYGFLIGVSPYAIGLVGMLIATGGPHAFAAFFAKYLHSLAVQNSPLSITQRLQFFFYLLHGTITDIGPCMMMLHNVTPLEMPVWKTILLLAVPCLAIAVGLLRPNRIVGLLLVLGMVLGVAVLVAAFGNRLWFQHAALLLPLLYVALALALEWFASLFEQLPRRAVQLCLVVIVAPFLISNSSDRQAVFLNLRTTGGVGLASDAIDRFAQDSLRQEPMVHVFFPDWGFFMQFAMLTRGAIPYSTDFTPAAAQSVLCSGIDAEVVTTISMPAKRLQDWRSAVAQKSTTTVYSDRQGTPVFLVTYWRQSIGRTPMICP